MTVLNKNGRRTENSVYIGRPSKWGNPFVIGPDGTRAEVIAKFEQYLFDNPRLIAAARQELRGRDLVCWCAPLPCHGDILHLVANGVFVFGSNLAGRHGKGAALTARRLYGAKQGQGKGLQGDSYAIPTKGYDMEVLELPTIARHVRRFIQFAQHNRNLTFNVTRIGCGLAGYTEAEIAPMFLDAPTNCHLPRGWR